MTEVEFHVNVADRLQYACRLLRKASRKGVRVAVTGSASVLNELDRQLWTFDAEEFIAHVRVAAGQASSSSVQRSPVWLVEDASVGAELAVLVNLGDELAGGFESYERLIEVVSSDDAERDAGRQRWKQYLARGYTPRKHEVAA
jgi:DNA polymerase-3 subunit chi